VFKFDQLEQIHLEITNNCQASCPMCTRNINSGLENPLIKIQNWTLGDFKTIMSEEVLKQIKSYYFCGNFGDPIINNDLIEMCRYTTEVSPDVRVAIHTNGGARSKAWWTLLAHALPKNHSVMFAIDGLEDTHQLYRVGTTYDDVVENARAFILAGGNAEWVFIKFKHNEHQVDEARRRANKLGFSKFTLKNSRRFIVEPFVKVLDRNGNLTHVIEPSTETPLKFIDRKIIDSYKQIVDSSVISCEVQKNKEVYIDAYKNLYPCCWLGNVPYSSGNLEFEVQKETKQQHLELVKKLGNTNTIDRSIKDIINSNEYQTVWHDYWNINKLIVCARTCSVNTSFSKPKDQFVCE